MPEGCVVAKVGRPVRMDSQPWDEGSETRNRGSKRHQRRGDPFAFLEAAVRPVFAVVQEGNRK